VTAASEAPASGLQRAAAVKLGAYNADIHQTSVSGISAGGYMAVQFHVAFSSILTGAGIFAGGPYHCSGSSGGLTTALTTCMVGSPAIDVNSLISVTDSRAAAGDIDATGNLHSQKVWLFSGTKDTTVHRPVMDALHQYYGHYIPAANIVYKTDLAAAHAHITDTYGNACGTSTSPYINNCNYDGPGALLQQIYGSLAPRNTGTLGGQLIQFDQSEFIASGKSMDTTGWVYVPAACARKEACKVHVAFHGCMQTQTQIKDAYYAHAGYNQWADTNHIIVLYPQAATSYLSPSNPNGCWDWWGYNDPASYDTKHGVQMAAIKKMVDRLTSGYAALPAPTGLVVSGTDDTSVSLSWSAVSGAASYNVYRKSGGNFVLANAAPVTATTYKDTGLTPGTTYSYEVRAVSGSGGEGDPSAVVSGATTGHAPMLPAPTGLAVGATTTSSVALSWSASSGAAGYNVYRSPTAGNPGARVNGAPLGATSYTDSGLAAGTTYYYAVTAVDTAGNESPASPAVAATTATAPPATCYRDNNWNHYVAGRATFCLGSACAVGSGQNMGLMNILTITTLKQTGPAYYVIGTCP
jgi:poly(3-hydroxybutyrate) depolymerase/chitodextrinase